MQPRFVGRLGLADAVTVANAIVGFLAIAVATVDVDLAARLILLAAVADGLDGVVARRMGGTSVGPYLDSLADVSSFAIAPAVLVVVLLRDATPPPVLEPIYGLLVLGIPALFVAMAIVRLGFYTAHDVEDTTTIGVQTTLAATILATTVLVGRGTPIVLLGATAAFAYLMVSSIAYPDLLARDALLMGVVHVLAVAMPTFYGRVFPYALLSLALAYLILAPWFYWGEAERSLRASGAVKGKRS